MLSSADFQAACASGKKQYEQYGRYYSSEDIRRHSLADLRRAGIFPME